MTTSFKPPRDHDSSPREFDFAREALRKYQKKYQKTEAVGWLIGGLAHDLNNPLTAVTGGSELLKRRLSHGYEIDRDVDMVQSGATRALALIQRLLACSRRKTLAPKPVDAATPSAAPSAAPSQGWQYARAIPHRS